MTNTKHASVSWEKKTDAPYTIIPGVAGKGSVLQYIGNMGGRGNNNSC